MSKKIVTYVLALAMIFSVFCNPAPGYAVTEETSSGITNTSTETDITDVANTMETGDSDQLAQETVPEGETAADVEAAKPAPEVAKVTNLKAKATSSKAIKLTWKKVKGAKGYQVYRYNKKKGKYVRIATVKKLQLVNIKLAANTSYSYKVRAYTVQDGKTYYGKYSKVVKCKTEKTDRMKVGELAKSKVGCKYVYGKSGPKCFDCSGFVYWVYNNADVSPEVKVTRSSSADMYRSVKKHMVGYSIKSIKKAKMGDILFFSYGGKVNHVGIYYKDGKMIHAANPKKDVCIEKVSDYNKWGYKLVGIASVLD